MGRPPSLQLPPAPHQLPHLINRLQEVQPHSPINVVTRPIALLLHHPHAPPNPHAPAFPTPAHTPSKAHSTRKSPQNTGLKYHCNPSLLLLYNVFVCRTYVL